MYLSVVITCHNNFAVTQTCIDSLKYSTIKPDEIILIDNGSTDATEQYFKDNTDIKYIRRKINDGSIIGRNVGIRLATGDKILILDNDQFVVPDTIEKYIQHDKDVVGCELRETNKHGIGIKVKEDTGSGRVYLGIGGLMITRDVVEKIGVLDESFAPAYCDDPDFFWRAIEAGLSWALVQDSGIIHMAHSTLTKVKTFDNDEAYKRSHDLLKVKWPLKFQPKTVTGPQPLVSYVVPTYNRVGFIEECLNSILSQTYKNIEIIVVDDGSTDGTGDLIKEKYPTVIYLYNEKNKKIPCSLNRGFRAAKGEFVCWLSDDDGIFPEKTEEQVIYMLENPQIDLSFTEYEIRWRGDASYTGKAGVIQHWRPIPFNSNHEEFIHCLTTETCNMNGSTAMFRKSAFRKMGYFIEMLYFVQDWEMWLRYLKAGTIGRVDKNLGYRNEHKDVSQGYCQNAPGVREQFVKEKNCVQKYYRLFTNPDVPSVCVMMCVKNEAFEIERCLDDIILWADKIVLFDDGSSDNTVELAEQYPKVMAIHKKDNPHNIRTEGIDRQILYDLACAENPDWICFLDCDEIFDDKMKWQIYDLITDPCINLYHFHEINFWRSETHYRIDESYNKGWFGRLFRNMPGLRMTTELNEHCGGIPRNIPGCSMWYAGDHEAARKTNIECKHYGFSDYQRNTGKAWRRWVRDPLRKDAQGNLHGGWIYYERMINETGLVTVEYKEEL